MDDDFPTMFCPDVVCQRASTVAVLAMTLEDLEDEEGRNILLSMMTKLVDSVKLGSDEKKSGPVLAFDRGAPDDE